MKSCGNTRSRWAELKARVYISFIYALLFTAPALAWALAGATGSATFDSGPEMDPDDSFKCTKDDGSVLQCSPASCEYWWPACVPRPVRRPKDFPAKCLMGSLACKLYSTPTLPHDGLAKHDDYSHNHNDHNTVQNNGNQNHGGGAQSEQSNHASSGNSGNHESPKSNSAASNHGGEGSGGGGSVREAPEMAGAGMIQNEGSGEPSTYSYDGSGPRLSAASTSPVLPDMNPVASSGPSGGGSAAGSTASASPGASVGGKGNGGNSESGSQGGSAASERSRRQTKEDAQAETSVDSTAAEKAAKARKEVNSEKSEHYSDPWLDYVSADSHKTLVDKLAKNKELREKLRARLKDMGKAENELSEEERDKMDYYETALRDADAILAHGGLNTLRPLEAREAFSMDGDETEREIRRLVATLDSEAAGLATKDEGIHYSLFPRVHRALWRQISNGKIQLRAPRSKN